MGSLLNETLNLVTGVAGGVINIFVSLFAWIGSVLLIVHQDFPRLEGLIIGILFAWFFIHRDKHPYLRVLAAPLKIILDTLDIIWSETVEALLDLRNDIKEKITGLGSWLWGKTKSMYGAVIGFLSDIKDRVTKKFDRKKE